MVTLKSPYPAFLASSTNVLAWLQILWERPEAKFVLIADQHVPYKANHLAIFHSNIELIISFFIYPKQLVARAIELITVQF